MREKNAHTPASLVGSHAQRQWQWGRTTVWGMHNRFTTDHVRVYNNKWKQHQHQRQPRTTTRSTSASTIQPFNVTENERATIHSVLFPFSLKYIIFNC